MPTARATLKERSWFDVPLVYTNQRRAIIAIEKGAPGERAFNDAFLQWGEANSTSSGSEDHTALAYLPTTAPPEPQTTADILNAKSGGLRVVFPPLDPNANPPSVASVSPPAVLPPAAVPNNGKIANSEPLRIKTLAVKGDQTDSTPAPAAAKPAGAAKAAAVAGQQVAATTPTQLAPASSGAGGGYIVQLSSQQSEESAQASYRVLQSKYSSVLGSRSPVVKRVDFTEKGKGIVYRAYAGPFGSQDEATQVCNNLKSAGLPQCFVQRN
jgi:hypothetical protein